tara:strand:- start:8584 stop:9369 length:786 start_codon:yes stop_codon:yes gene_type:complete
MTFHYGSPQKTYSLKDTIRFYPESEFEKLTCSTIPMLSLMAHDKRTFHSLVRKMDIPAKDYTAYLEYTVLPKHGKGKVSCTDVMLINGENSLAVEAKWTEGMYPDAKKWISKGDNEQNKRDVLKGWIDCLKKHLGKPLNPDDFHDTIYQMVHRAASAVEAGKKPAVAYFCFKMNSLSKGAKTEKIVKRLTELWNLLEQPSTLPFYIAEIEIVPTEVYESLQIEAETKSKKELSEYVIAALQSKKSLFEFLPKPVVRIGSNP